MTNDKQKLKEACYICVADIGKEDRELSEALYMHIALEYGTVAGRDWDYDLVDRVLMEMI